MECFFKNFFTSTYNPGPLGPYDPGPLINNLEEYSSFKCSRTIFENHTAPEAYSKHAPGAVCISNMVLEHI